MQKTFLLSFLIVCCLAGCETNPPAPSPAAGIPDPSNRLSEDQITQLKSRLDLLQVGMSRAQVLEILDLEAFNVRSFASANRTGITYHIELGHTLTLGMEAGDYASTLRWAKFDGELWPKNYAPRPQPPPNAP